MPERKTSRRAFFQGQAAIDAIADALPTAAEHSTSSNAPAGPIPNRPDDFAIEPSSTPFAGPSSYLICVGRSAMACEFEVFFNAGQYADGTEAAIAALDLVDRLEEQLTVYRPSSEVSRLNREAAERDVEVEPRLFALLRFACELHRRTGGAYDITSGPLSKAWGFFRRAGQIPSDDDLAEALAGVGSQHLALDEAASNVRFLRPGLEINLGSIGKGYALDRAADFLEARGIADFLIHGGQSSMLARGSRGLAGEGWWVGLRDPLRPEERLGEIRLRNRALGTSGSLKQFFYHEGRRYGHILDPRTGRPAQGMLSSTVLAPTAAEADALSTAMFVMGMDSAVEYCRSHPKLAAVLVAPGTKHGGVDLRVIGLDEADWKPAGAST
ncbi:MAG TPA: FAD:protein FMN transferase [Pirellulales bacterium]